ncbi:hypothetical protein DFQ28_008251 [Apophysomyces sp. BC1034]|nr:hypothetical protein DFQ30_007376 [Apophysomyces sp. BC1015]KAG0182751.1 hypothetical protein DFQ29_002386 [Apophysomyces sp. BC1021]KAG0186149.1 hypothetical protein DFQ28_008251 [Apophysomyces sp. BC1034]
MMFTWLLCSFILATVQAIPIHSPAVTSDCATSDENFGVNTDHFAQLVATHWQFDHFESIISGTCKEIADVFQSHIDISTAELPSLSEEPQQRLEANGMMDADILQAQIAGAIQAHTEGILPQAWDSLAEQLGRPAMEERVRQVLATHCPGASRQTVDSRCLVDKASQISSSLDRYVANHLGHIFDVLDRHVLPDMLDHTAKDLQDVLNYFNIVLLQHENRQFSLTVAPWSKPQTPAADHSRNIEDRSSLKFRLLRLATQSMVNEDHHPATFIAQYAHLARV